MIHFATAHRGGRWVDVQLAYLRRHVTEPFRVWASTEEVPAADAAKFDVALEMSGNHAGKLNRLWYALEEEVADEDIVVFIDSDAFPIADPLPLIRDGLNEHALVAVQRLENDGDPQPHPSFAAARAMEWRRIGCDWSAGHAWTRTSGARVSDVGGNLLHLLDRADATWRPLHRTNAIDLHPVRFGIYGNVIYHHGAGTRTLAVTPRDEQLLPFRQSGFLKRPLNALVHLRRRSYLRRVEALSAAVYDDLRNDPAFWRRFVAEGAAT